MREPVRTPGIPSLLPLPSLALLAPLAVVSSLALSCLPGDTRPPPESVYVTAEPGEALRAGFETADGWQITFGRLVLAVGNVDFEWEDTTCTSYAEANYDRLFDFAVAGREKVGTVYGIGTCNVEFRLRRPSFDVLLGPGVTAEDVAFMRRRATDRFVEDEGVSVIAVGSAARGDERRNFKWLFRQSYDLTNCADGSGGYTTKVELTEGAASELRLEVRGEELFRASADDSAELRFQPLADADADGDLSITLDELSRAPRPLEEIGEGEDAGVDAGAEPESLEDLVYGKLLPRLLRVKGGGACEAEQRRGGRR